MNRWCFRNRMTRGKRTWALAAMTLAILFSPLAAADNPITDFLSFYSDERTGNYFKGELAFNTAHFGQTGSWAGADEELLGDDSNFWGEYGVLAALEGQYGLDNGSRFQVRVSGVYTNTNHGLDAGGSNLTNSGDDWGPNEDVTLEDAYLRWSSGELFGDLGVDAIEITLGSQVYKQGAGFLFYDAGSDGGERGGFWLGMRKAYQRSALVKLTTGNWMAEAYYLRPDSPGEDTDMAGLNVEYTFNERANVGISYTNIYDSDDDRRDGLDILDLRASVVPFGGWERFRIEGELALEDNGSDNDSWGGYAKFMYTFEEGTRWQPSMYYRIAHFTGDDGTGDNEAFDPINYGFNDWNEWFIGEIIGEYVSSNRNLTTHTLNLNVQPAETFAAGVYYIYYHLDEKPGAIVPRPPTSPRAALITDRSLAHEINFTADWDVTDNIYVGMMAGFVITEDGAEDFFGDDETWGVFMLNLGFSF